MGSELTAISKRFQAVILLFSMSLRHLRHHRRLRLFVGTKNSLGFGCALYVMHVYRRKRNSFTASGSDDRAIFLRF